MHEVKAFPGAEVAQGLGYRHVDAVGALAAADDQDRERFPAGRGGVPARTGGGLHDLPAQGVARPHDLARVETTAGPLESGVDAVGERRQAAVGDAGQRVLLAQGHGPPEQPGRHDHGPGRVTAQADHQVRPEGPHDSRGLQDGAGQAGKRPHLVPNAAAFQPFDRDRLQREPRPGESRALEVVAPADEEHAVVRVAGADLLGDGNPREEVPAGAAPGDDHPQRPGSDGRRYGMTRRRCRRSVFRQRQQPPGAVRALCRRHAGLRAVLPAAPMFIRIPTVAMFNTSDVPP